MTRSALDAAMVGDEHAFSEVVAPHLSELHRHCYRMLGSITDAEDIRQEVLLAAWRGLPDFAGRSSVRTWLYRIATNHCLNAIRDGRRRNPPEPVPPFEPPEPSRRSEITWLQPYPDAWLDERPGGTGPAERYQQREAIELAFIAALQRLPPRQAASLLLCDVLAYTTAEVAAMLDTTATSVKGTLQRARRSLDEGRATPAADSVPRSSADTEQALARRFADALTTDDIDGVIALLTDDAWLAMPPAPHEYHRSAAIAAFLRTSARWRGPHTVQLVATQANRQPAFLHHLAGPDGSSPVPTGIIVLTICGDRISGIIRFLDDRLPGFFDRAVRRSPQDWR